MAARVAPAAQASTNSYADVVGTKIDTFKEGGGASAVSYQVKAATNGITFKVVGSNDDTTYMDIKAVDETGAAQASVDLAVASGATDILGVPTTAAPFRFYKVQEKDTVGGSHGDGTVVGIAK